VLPKPWSRAGTALFLMVLRLKRIIAKARESAGQEIKPKSNTTSWEFEPPVGCSFNPPATKEIKGQVSRLALLFLALLDTASLYTLARPLPCCGILAFSFARCFCLRSCLVSSTGHHLISYEPRMKSKFSWRVEMLYDMCTATFFLFALGLEY